MACARDLADAETYASEHDWCFSREPDQDADWSWMSEAERKQDHEVFGYIVRDMDGNVLASCWSIFDPSPEYSRVMKAELASEAMANELSALRDLAL
jgi:hypothetical protein